MTLPSAGQIALDQVNTELNKTSSTTTSLNDTDVRTLFAKPTANSIISMQDGYGKSNVFNYTISASTAAATDLRSFLISNGWNGTSKVNLTINFGVYVYGVISGGTTYAAMTISGSFPNGINIINNGSIVGASGTGGNGAGIGPYNGTAGQPGGPAIVAISNVTITNNGIVGGGGGGGGGGRACQISVPYSGGGKGGGYPTDWVAAGGGGGGGQGGSTTNTGGAAGPAGGAYNLPAAAGTTGTLTSVGTGSNGSNNASYLGATYNGSQNRGGNGGALGAAGLGGNGFAISNTTSFWGPTSGGAAGAAVVGNANISWLATGTRYGAIS
jgi:hypothetical protein